MGGLFKIAAVGLAALAAASASARLDPETVPLSEVVVGSAGAPGPSWIQVSGRVLAGMAIGQRGGRVELSKLRALLPSTKDTQRLCLDVSARDGSYLARNSFRIGAASAGGTAGINYPTKFASVFANRKLSDLALRAEIKADCADPKDGLFVPVMFSDQGWPAADTLIVLVNAQDRMVTAQLRSKDATLAEAICAKAVGGANVAFTDLCSFAPFKGRADRLRITTQGLLGNASSYDLRLGLP